MRRRTGKRIASLVWAWFLALVLILAAACGGDDERDVTPSDEPAAPQAVIRVVTTSNILADWARVIGGDRVEVVSLMPVDVDPHTFQPGPRDAAQIAEADVILAVGLGMERFWLEDLLRSLARDPGIVLALGDSIDPIHSHADDETADDEDHEHDEDEDEHADDEENGHDEDDDEHADDEDHEHDEDENEHADDEENGHDEDDDEHADDEDHEHDEDEDEHADDEEDGHADEEDAHGHVHGPENPHFWFDPIRVMSAVNAIAARFSKLDPANADVYFTNAAAYNEELDELHHWIEDQVNQVPQDHRFLVTSHDSFRYFAERYGFEVLGVILGVTTDVEASAEHLANLVEEMKEHNVRAVFGETITSERLAQSLANETGATLVRLYSDSLGAEGSGAETYIGMVRANVKLVVEALQ